MDSKTSCMQAPAFVSGRSQPKSWVCPDDNSIPRIRINLWEDKVNIEIQCDENRRHQTRMRYDEYVEIWDRKKLALSDQKCTFVLSHKENKAEGYCVICRKFICKVCKETHEAMPRSDNGVNHTIINEEAIIINVKPFCKEDKSFNNYWHCLDCSENWCKKCKTSQGHINHRIIDTTEILSTEDVNNWIKAYKDFEVEYFARLLHSKTKWIEQLNQWYDYNYHINLDLFNYVNNQLQMYHLWKETNNYNWLCNLKDICDQINFKICNYDEQGTAEENAKNIIAFFRNNWILDIYKPFKCTTTIQNESLVCSWCKLSNEDFAVGFYNGDIKIIDYRTSKVQRELKGHSKHVWRWYQHRRKNYLISLSLDKTVVIWNHSLGQTIQTLKGHTHQVRGIAETENGNIITCSADRSLKLWDIHSFECIKTITNAHADFIYDIRLLKDRRWVSCGEDNAMKVWKDNINTRDDVTKSIVHNSVVCALLQWRDERLVAGTQSDVVIYDVINSFKRWAQLKGHTKCVSIWTELSNGLVATGSDDHSVMIWNLRKYECEQVLKEHTSNILTAWVDWDGRAMLSGGVTKLWRDGKRSKREGMMG